VLASLDRRVALDFESGMLVENAPLSIFLCTECLNALRDCLATSISIGQRWSPSAWFSQPSRAPSSWQSRPAPFAAPLRHCVSISFAHRYTLTVRLWHGNSHIIDVDSNSVSSPEWQTSRSTHSSAASSCACSCTTAIASSPSPPDPASSSNSRQRVTSPVD
jgi:hypothetical protein